MSAKKSPRPKYSTEEVLEFISQTYELTGELVELPSERDQNYYIKTETDIDYVVKIANQAEKREVLEFQNAAMNHLTSQELPFNCPKVVKSIEDDEITPDMGKKSENLVRLLTYVPGKVFAKVNPHSEEFLTKFGIFLGSLTNALTGFNHPATHREFYWDLKNTTQIIDRYVNEIEDLDKRELIKNIKTKFDSEIIPVMDDFRMSVIHSDANDYNIVFDGERFGIIDFGDMVYTATIFELAIGVAYAILDKNNPLDVASWVVSGYNSVYNLTDIEIQTLFTLICSRLAMSVVLSAHQQKLEPDNEYLIISQKPAWRTLEQLMKVNSEFAHFRFRTACGLPCLVNSQDILTWITQNQNRFSKLFDIDVENSIIFDLSISSFELSKMENYDDTKQLAQMISMKMENAGRQFALGRYNEARLQYINDSFEFLSETSTKHRTVHLGIDLYCAPGTAVYAPLDGTVYGFGDHADHLDYGPTVILEHKTDDDQTFYTLFAHLRRGDMNRWSIGKEIKGGKLLGHIGSYNENGNWPPHLHFQIILDMMRFQDTYPGVIYQGERDLWLELCPNPNLILGIDKLDEQTKSLTNVEIIESRSKRIGKSLSIAYEKPLKIVKGNMQYLHDEDGGVYLDAVNNVPHVGHSHPRVVEAIQRQVAVLNTNTRYLHDNLVQYAEKLCSYLPEPLKVCFFVNSGSEANELALRIAKTYTAQSDIIVLDGAYHGNTGNLVDISPYKFDGPGGVGAPPSVHKIPMPDPYRGKYRGRGTDIGIEYAKELENRINKLKKKNRGVAAFIFEPLLGCGGQIVMPERFLENAMRIVHEAGGLCIADEVQVGFGRVGTHFWGFETQNIVPDIVTLGKPIGNGHPIGAVITTTEIADKFANGMEFFTTTGGNTVSCAVGMAVLDVIKDEKLQDNALTVGNYLKNELIVLMDKHHIIGEVRGLGLYLGVELVKSRETLEPAADEANYIINRMKEFGILLSTDGPYHNVLKIKPPLVFTKENAAILTTTLDKILEEDFVQVEN
ncbi:MAG: aminotransferase class III-fold pyridoxal phosphate-dependent enzyme [Candidatus Kariarchaeaceae archaeon]|jgi:4-aminobutyrate aminotransferase-like enzyme/Ser/Thr protein kinase RdoA (MazF antagonist)